MTGADAGAITALIFGGSGAYVLLCVLIIARCARTRTPVTLRYDFGGGDHISITAPTTRDALALISAITPPDAP